MSESIEDRARCQRIAWPLKGCNEGSSVGSFQTDGVARGEPARSPVLPGILADPAFVTTFHADCRGGRRR